MTCFGHLFGHLQCVDVTYPKTFSQSNVVRKIKIEQIIVCMQIEAEKVALKVSIPQYIYIYIYMCVCVCV
jgi:hypothetical protein